MCMFLYRCVSVHVCTCVCFCIGAHVCVCFCVGMHVCAFLQRCMFLSARVLCARCVSVQVSDFVLTDNIRKRKKL